MKSKIVRGMLMGAALGLAILTPCNGRAGVFRIQKVKYDERGGQSMWINKERAWKTGYPQLCAIVSCRDDINSPTFLRAYFFDEDKKLVGEIKKPACVWGGGDTFFGAPAKLTRRTELMVMFEVPQDLADKKWSRAIVVFGNDSEAVAEADPRSTLDDYAYPEKELVDKSK